MPSAGSEEIEETAQLERHAPSEWIDGVHRGLGRTKGGHHRQENARFEVAANLFPLLGETDLVALGNDINRNGLTNPIAIQVKDGKPVLVDGRNRLDAMESSGCEFVWSEPTPDRGSCWSRNNSKTSVGSDCLFARQIGATVMLISGDPVEFITSANVHRRHLPAETKRDPIAKLLQENPERSDRATAKLVEVDHKTVGAVRCREEDVGNIPHVEKVIDTKGRRQPTTKSAKPPNPPRRIDAIGDSNQPIKRGLLAMGRAEATYQGIEPMPAETKGAAERECEAFIVRAFETRNLAYFNGTPNKKAYEAAQKTAQAWAILCRQFGASHRRFPWALPLGAWGAIRSAVLQRCERAPGPLTMR